MPTDKIDHEHEAMRLLALSGDAPTKQEQHRLKALAEEHAALAATEKGA